MHAPTGTNGHRIPPAYHLAENEMKKKKSSTKEKHLWKVSLRHRDWFQTANSRPHELRMTFTTLFIVCPQWPSEKPCIERAMARTRRFLRSHQRQYGIFTIRSIIYDGIIDE
jgi:hypothetical protein